MKLKERRHDVDALLAQSGADGRCRSRLAGRDLQLNVASDFLCHTICTSKICGELRSAARTSHEYAQARTL